MNNYKKLADVELVSYLKRGDRKAFSVIYDRYWGKLFCHAKKMLNDEEEASDVVQELFTNIWYKRESLNVFRLDGYLYGTMRNQILHFMAHQKVITKYTTSLSYYLESGVRSQDSIMVENELLQLFEQELAALPVKMRTVFEMSRGEGLSHKQIAEKLDISDKTVKKQIYYATKIFREKIRIILF
ncbi:RNA polymerase sigma-70 factor, ECF subfamily [Pedobacter sp. ok626]|uniref:RNA polymerase sigma factor n=1 Tax=Pedobacter sp. ok626 TaxID=1761882 RepID=UPI0008884614|nr:RNA polymerase sigma-70 factor [Pedobacter sp. ok626]SDL15820.1 RNA polymerase sigma-70 factor, ECF subfamily [Pedobacter sp. ok626]